MFWILVLLASVAFEAANASLQCNVTSVLKRYVPNQKGNIEAIAGLTMLTGMDGGNPDNLFTGSQATPKTKNEVAAMCSDYEPPGNEYCVVTPNSFSLGASDKFALAKVGPAPQCLIINPNDNYMSINFT